jgi:hypothetical protein
MRMKSLVTVALALAAVALGAATAAAETLTFNPAGAISLTGRPVWREAGGATITCNLILRGTFERTIATTRETSMGSITSATSEGCSGGTIRTLTPNGMVYFEVLRSSEQLIGVLIGIRTFGVLIERPFFYGCLYSATQGILIRVNRELSIEATLLESPWSPSITLFGSCPVMRMSGGMTLSPQQTVRLI